MSTERRERIRELLIEELTETGELAEGDVVTHFLALVGAHQHDHDENGDHDEGGVHAVTSSPTPPIHVQLGLMDYHRIYAQAVMSHAVATTRGDDD